MNLLYFSEMVETLPRARKQGVLPALERENGQNLFDWRIFDNRRFLARFALQMAKNRRFPAPKRHVPKRAMQRC
jgi:hypothetical protein